MEQVAMCANCGAQVSSPFCPACGQANRPVELGLRRVAGEFVAEVALYDSKLWRTLRALVLSPGALTVEWSRGRRTAFVSPVRLYLAVSVLFFALFAWTSESHTNVRLVGLSDSGKGSSKGGGWAEALGRKAERVARVEPERVSEAMVNAIPKGVFVLLPAFALLLKLCFRRRTYVEHLVFALHTHAFLFLILGLILTLRTPWIEVPLALTLPVYAWLALRRVYGGPWPIAALKGVVIFFGHLFLNVAITVLVTFYALATLDDVPRGTSPRVGAAGPVPVGILERLGTPAPGGAPF